MYLTVTQEPLIMPQSPLVLLKRLRRGWNIFRDPTQFSTFAFGELFTTSYRQTWEIGSPENLLQSHLHIESRRPPACEKLEGSRIESARRGP
jgi:hypothetical protein